MICRTILDLHEYHKHWNAGKIDSYDPFVNAFLILQVDSVKVFYATDYGEKGRVELFKDGKLNGVIHEEDFPVCTIINGINKINGRGFNWVSDGDGSLEKLRNSITWQ